MTKTFRFYTILHPLRPPYIDDGTSVLISILVTESGRRLELALIGPPNDPRMIRVSVRGIEEEPTSDEIRRFDDLAEVLLALVRIFCDNRIALAEPRLRYANMLDDDSPPSLNMRVIGSEPAYMLDPGIATAFMQSDKELKDLLRLYADSLMPFLPVQYRYLSAFKIIEHEFKVSRRKWKPELDVLLSHFTTEYEALQISKMNMKALMISLRDKCAHIKIGDANELAIVGIGSPATGLVIRFLPLLTKIIQKHIFDVYKSDGVAFRAV